MEPSNSGSQTGKGRFLPGNQFGKGRSRGSRNKATVVLEQMGQTAAVEVWASVLDQATLGDPTAMRLVVERIYPVPKGRLVKMPKLPSVKDAAGVSAALDALLEQVRSGKLSPDEAGTIAGVLEVRRKTIETVDLEARLAALEKRPQP